MAESKRAKQVRRMPARTLKVPHTHCFVGDQATDIALLIDLKTMRLGSMHLAGGAELSKGEQADVMESFRQNDDWGEWFAAEDPRVIEAIANALQNKCESPTPDDD